MEEYLKRCRTLSIRLSRTFAMVVATLVGFCVAASYWWFIYKPFIPVTPLRLWLVVAGSLCFLLAFGYVLSRAVESDQRPGNTVVAGVGFFIMLILSLAVIPIGLLYNTKALSFSYGSNVGSISVTDLDRVSFSGESLSIVIESEDTYLGGKLATNAGFGAFKITQSEPNDAALKDLKIQWHKQDEPVDFGVFSETEDYGTRFFEYRQGLLVAVISFQELELARPVKLTGYLSNIQAQYAELDSTIPPALEGNVWIYKYQVKSAYINSRAFDLWLFPYHYKDDIVRAQSYYIQPSHLFGPCCVFMLVLLFHGSWIVVNIFNESESPARTKGRVPSKTLVADSSAHKTYSKSALKIKNRDVEVGDFNYDCPHCHHSFRWEPNITECDYCGGCRVNLKTPFGKFSVNLASLSATWHVESATHRKMKLKETCNAVKTYLRSIEGFRGQ